MRAVYLKCVDIHKFVTLAKLHLTDLCKRNAFYFTKTKSALFYVNPGIVWIVCYKAFENNSVWVAGNKIDLDRLAHARLQLYL